MGVCDVFGDAAMLDIKPGEILTTKEVARLTGVPEGTLKYWRAIDQGPRSFLLNPRRMAYRRSDVLAWLTTQLESTSRGGHTA